MAALLGRLLNRGAHRAAREEPVDIERVGEEIQQLSRENQESRDPEREAQILRLRRLAGIGLKERATERPDVVEADGISPNGGGQLPEAAAAELTPGLIRAGILDRGALIARRLVDPRQATALAREIDRAIDASRAAAEGEPTESGCFELLPGEELGPSRSITMSTGTLLLADTPRVAFDLISLYESTGLEEVIAGYLNEQPALSADKTTLRRATPSEPGGWHQDGKFLGDVNSLNVWLALSHCGDTAPGLDLVPHRLEEIVDAGVGPGGLDAITVPHEEAERLAGDSGIARPIFEPGDAIFFDHFNLHRTGADPAMTDPRYAIESWFFGPSAFPEGYTALAL